MRAGGRLVLGTMPGVGLSFTADEEEAFAEARDGLLAQFAGWRDTTERAVFDAQLLLDWRWGYSDGDLATWTTAQLDEFLLEWCPRKVSMSPSEAPELVMSLRRFFTFLAAEGVLGLGSSSLRALDAHLMRVRAPFVQAMSDRSRFGMAKSLFAGMADRGLGSVPDGADEVQAMMDAFNELSFAERGEILGLSARPRDPWAELTEGVELPPAMTLAAHEAAMLAAAAPVLGLFEVIRGFVGTGRRLTEIGNLTVADAKALADRLGVDAATDTEAGVRVGVRSADDLGELQFLLRWARAAGATRSARGRLSATASWSKLDPLAAVRRAVKAILDKGPTRTRFGNTKWAPSAVHEVLDDGAPHLLALLWAIPEPLPFDELAEAAIEVCDQRLAWAPIVSPESQQRQITAAFATLFDVLAVAGVATRDNVEVTTDAYGYQRERGGELSLTSLGRVVLGDILKVHGYTIPEVGELVSEPLAALFDQIGVWHPDRICAEFDAWAAAHTPSATVDALVATLQQPSDPERRIVAIQFAARLPDPVTESAVRALLDTPARGQALGWLHEHGCRDIPDDPAALFAAGVELFWCLSDADHEEFIRLVTQIDDLAGFIDRAWRIREPYVGELLAAIGRLHPDRALAKTARKAVIRHQSHLANLH